MDLERLPEDVRRSARVISSGQVEWPLEAASQAVEALVRLGVVIVELELRGYGPDGSITDVAWSASSPAGLDDAARDVDFAVRNAREAGGAFGDPLPLDCRVLVTATG